MSAIMDYNESLAENRQLDYNAQVQFNNAESKLREASYARQQSERNAAERSKDVAALIGRQRALMGASGAVVDSGSFMDTTLATAEQGARDSMALLEEGDLESWRRRSEANLYEHSGKMILKSKKSPLAMHAKAFMTGHNTFTSTYSSLGSMGGMGF